MKRTIGFISIALLLFCCACSCEKPSSGNNPDGWNDYYDKPDTGGDTDSQTPDYPERKVLVGADDMVLIYGGSSHRNPADWSETYLKDYVRYTDAEGHDKWFFDGFLLLEFMLTQYDKTLVTGYQYNGVYLKSANKDEWEALVNYYFKPGTGVNALESAIETCARSMGNPPSKRKVFIGIPEPIKMLDSHSSVGGSDYWGSIDGAKMDFSLTADRIKAVKWYIDKVREKFREADFKYIELAGFYWVAEKATQSRDIVRAISDYLHDNMYAFSWIPYFNADGYADWKTFGFDFAYLQPNYFFYNSPFEKLTTACNNAIAADMGMEVEFDGNAMASSEKKLGYKLRDYLSEFKKYGIWEKRRIAYYQGSWAVRWLKYSSNAEDQKLYHELGEWVTSRPLRNKDR